jgi:TetR/AcrR family transcriptional regulator, transcriptional repressor for nem operon
MPRPIEFIPDEILDKATSLFWHKGYHDVSTQNLVDEMNIGRSSLYNSFTDKKTLFITCLKRYQYDSLVSLIQMNADDVDAETVILDIFQTIKTYSTTDKFFKGCFLVNTAVELAPHDPEIAEIIKINRENLVTNLTQIIQKSIDNSIIKPDFTASSLANFYYNMFNALKVDTKSVLDEDAYQASINIALSLLNKNQ